MTKQTLENEYLSVTVDTRGRLVSLVNKQTGTELITNPEAAEAWRMVLPTGRHRIDVLLGSQQKPQRIQIERTDRARRLCICYDRLTGRRTWRIRARFLLSVDDGGREISVHVEIENRSGVQIQELEFPIVGGLGGQGRRRQLNLLAAGDRGDFYTDILHKGLPVTGRESNHFVREHETAMFEPGSVGGVWVDLWCRREGLFFGLCANDRDVAIKLEKFPKEVPNAPAHCYPRDTARWVRASGVHAVRLGGRAGGTTHPVVIMPHKGDWHAGADRYAADRHRKLKAAEPPKWMDRFVGWTEILGKTYLGEVFHDYQKCAASVIRDARVTGLDFVFYYGHTRLGSEGADFDHCPDPQLGGRRRFREMVDRLHRKGIRIMLLDHMHRWINRDLSQYRELALSKHAVLDRDGNPSTARWWKETYLSCRRLSGPTPVWVE
ncbi:MAG: hypothetical protein KAX78_11305, partial [Phycisphaerae bacterium]|nr:hypothetical protein [Phycisphaerae bacterium]